MFALIPLIISINNNYKVSEKNGLLFNGQNKATGVINKLKFNESKIITEIESSESEINIEIKTVTEHLDISQ